MKGFNKLEADEKFNRMIRTTFWHYWHIICCASLSYYILGEPFITDNQNDHYCKLVKSIYNNNKSVFDPWLDRKGNEWIKEWLQLENYYSTYTFPDHLDSDAFLPFINIIKDII